MPAVNADLDFENVITGEKIFTPRDNTDLNGVFGVAVPAGIYEVTYDGDPNALPVLAPGFLEEISVDGSQDLVLPAVELSLGYTVTGEVLGEFGIAVQGADLDFVDSVTGEKLPTKNDKTSASGVYNVLVPAGTYDIEYMPPSGSNLASVARASVTVNSNTFVPRVDMQPGRAISGTVIDPDGRLLGAVDLDAFSSSSGAAVPIGDDDTDAAGRYQVRMLDGTYDLRYNALRNSQVATDTNFAVSISGDAELATMILPWHDQDLDGFADVNDNCPHTVNGGQLDTDNDGVGDVCDNCPGASNARQEDNDLDRIGDACDPDDDNDGISDASDSDSDGDLVQNRNDNCPDLRNPLQRDSDSDGQGDACDPNDGLIENIVVSGDEEFTWRAETGATGYKVYRVSMRALSSINFGTCYHAAPEKPAMVADSDPDPGEGFVYIVTADMNGGEGSMGVGSSGEERPNLRACP